MSRLKILSGNWKMNNGPKEALEYFTAIGNPGATGSAIRLIFTPAYLLGSEIQTAAKKAGIQIGAQNSHWEEKGAFTAELSPTVLKQLGLNWTLIAHSERRQFFGETDESAGKRFKRALLTGLNVVFCIGETLQERESGQMNAVLTRQLSSWISVVKELALALNKQGGLIASIAYEPVWAIGTGKTATPEQAQEAHAFIRSVIRTACGDAVASLLPILYGGSVTADNAATLLKLPDVDGVLVGGASLKTDQFSKILTSV